MTAASERHECVVDDKLGQRRRNQLVGVSERVKAVIDAIKAPDRTW